MSGQNALQPVVRRGPDSLSAILFLVVKRYKLRLQQFLLDQRVWFIALFQAVLIFCSLVLAWLLRFDFSLPNRLLLFSAAPILILIRIAAITQFGLLRGWWRYTDVNDALAIFKAIAVGSAAFFISMRFVLGMPAFPRSVYVLEAVLSLCLLAGVRVISRAIAETVRKDAAPQKHVILIGAGFAAEMAIREIQRLGSRYRAVACVDDDRSKAGIKLHGVPVIGAVDELPALARQYGAEEILIAVPSATGSQMKRFVEVCEQTGVGFKTVPSLQDIISGRVSISQFRDVHLEDLLGREPVRIDLESVRSQIKDQAVLVTGAAGSIGSELCRQILQYGPEKLVCLDQSETGIFYLQLELLECKSRSQVILHVADVADEERMRAILSEDKPRIVFHAAAYKHVPVMERNVQEAVKNNVFALFSLLGIAEENGCKSFVLISSDKAVRPTNVMGATKRIGEQMISCRPANSMRCVSVRFGNVLGSNGSVVPILQKQLRENQQLTLTHPEIKRFFMTTCEAVSLVLQAFALGNHGDILLLDMGEPVRILDLARTLIRLSGRSEQEVNIKFTGLREGEKLAEELSYPTEEVHPTAFPKIKRIMGTPNRWFELQQHIEQLRMSMYVDGAAPIRAKLKEIVPEYTYRLPELSQELALPCAPKPAAEPVAPRKAVGAD